MTLTAEQERPLDRDDWRAWGTVAANSFGGPAGQIAAMHDEIVERRAWVDEPRFLHALNFCMLLPGPEAQQLATYLGWQRKGPKGALLAGGLFVLPGFVSILILSVLYATWGDVGWVDGLFRGVGPAVIAIVGHAVYRIGGRTIKNPIMLAIAVAAFVAVFFYSVPFPLVVLVAGVLGYVGVRLAPEVFMVVTGHEVDADVDAVATPSWSKTLTTAALGLGLWFGPLVVIVATMGLGSVWSDIGIFFSQAAVVTFGGAYSVLAYMAQQAVEVFGWLEPGEMIDGLGMAETTPGPLVQVTQFVGYMAAFRNPGSLSPITAGVLGAVLTTWMTFVPSFLWIFLGAPYMEALRGKANLSGALSTITAAVVGVILNLGVWFSIFTLFAEVGTTEIAGATVYRPDLATIDVVGLAIAIGAGVLLFKFNWSILRVVLLAAVLGIGLSAF